MDKHRLIRESHKELAKVKQSERRAKSADILRRPKAGGWKKKQNKRHPFKSCASQENPGEDPPEDANEAAANIDDRLKHIYMAREAVSKNKLRILLQINDDTGGNQWTTGGLEIPDEKLVDAILCLPTGKAVPGDGGSHEMTVSLATLPKTERPRATGIPKNTT